MGTHYKYLLNGVAMRFLWQNGARYEVPMAGTYQKKRQSFEVDFGEEDAHGVGVLVLELLDHFSSSNAYSEPW